MKPNVPASLFFDSPSVAERETKVAKLPLYLPECQDFKRVGPTGSACGSLRVAAQVFTHNSKGGFCFWRPEITAMKSVPVEEKSGEKKGPSSRRKGGKEISHGGFFKGCSQPSSNVPRLVRNPNYPITPSKKKTPYSVVWKYRFPLVS